MSKPVSAGLATATDRSAGRRHGPDTVSPHAVEGKGRDLVAVGIVGPTRIAGTWETAGRAGHASIMRLIAAAS
jgi:hypothetical protein